MSCSKRGATRPGPPSLRTGLARDALDTADRAESNADVSEEIAELAESAAAAAASTAKRAREAAAMARAMATDARGRGVPDAHQAAHDAAADTASARDLYHQSEQEARRRHLEAD